MTSNSYGLWHKLNGIICIYKPPRLGIRSVMETIRMNICRELNEDVPTTGVPYHRNPLVIGRLFNKERFNMYPTITDHSTSGVLVIGIKKGWQSARAFRHSCPLKVYHVKGRLGEASDEFFIGGVIRERATYHHVTMPIMEKVMASMQFMHQKNMFDACGVDIRTQAAYELAVKGLLKPKDPNIPIFYGIKCIHFDPPDFTVEVQCVNETSLYLKRMIHQIGFRLRSVALCTAVRCIRYGPFTVEHALARHRWKLADVLENMTMCTKIYISDAISERNYSPKLITSPEDSWEETERLLLEKGIIKEIAGSETSEDKEILEAGASSEHWTLKPAEHLAIEKQSAVLNKILSPT